MQFLFDNITASLVGMTVILILSSMQMRAVQQRVTSTARTTVQSQARQMTAWLEQDLEGIGRNMKSSDIAFENPEKETDKKWLTTEFIFDRIRNGNRVKTRYRVEPTGEFRTVYTGDGDEDIELYRFIREEKVVGTGGGWTENGGGMSSIEYFDVDLLDENAEPVSNPENNEEEVRSVRIRFSLIAPYQTEGATFPVTRTNVVIAPYPLSGS